MTNTDFDWQIDEFMVYCRSTQLREKTMASYEQTLRLFERWCREQLNIVDVDMFFIFSFPLRFVPHLFCDFIVPEWEREPVVLHVHVCELRIYSC